MKIYTKTGDNGQTSLFGGKRVSKASLRVEAYGTIDELNSAIGVAIAGVQSSNVKLKSELINIQNDLLEIGSELAGSKRLNLDQGPTFIKKRVGEIESVIDNLSGKLPPLKNFILPNGSESASFLHFARSVCRRAERRIVALLEDKGPNEREAVDKNILIYLNRLSDLLFTMARFVNLKENKKEIIWRKR